MVEQTIARRIFNKMANKLYEELQKDTATPYQKKLRKEFFKSLADSTDQKPASDKEYDYLKKLQGSVHANEFMDIEPKKEKYASGGLVSRQVSGFGKARKK